MDFTLPPEALATGCRLVAYDTIGSTNADAMARLRAGEPAPLWVVARHQTEGRGRRGSAWNTASGNLAASLALRADLPPATIATLGFVAGVALLRALERCWGPGAHPPPCGEGGLGGAEPGGGRAEPSATVSRHRPDPHPAASQSTLPARGRATTLQLKWPNDVLADGAKLAGILLETENLPANRRGVVIGIGVNVAEAPQGLPYRAASLAGLGHAASAEQVFEALSAEWVAAYATWDEGRGFDDIRTAWLARAAGLGRPVTIRTGAGVATGTFETIDAQGQLVLRAGAGTLVAVSAGEVHFGEAATMRPEVAA